MPSGKATIINSTSAVGVYIDAAVGFWDDLHPTTVEEYRAFQRAIEAAVAEIEAIKLSPDYSYSGRVVRIENRSAKAFASPQRFLAACRFPRFRLDLGRPRPFPQKSSSGCCLQRSVRSHTNRSLALVNGLHRSRTRNRQLQLRRLTRAGQQPKCLVPTN